MVTRISSEAKRALEAMDQIDHGMPDDAKEQVRLLLEYNRIIKLLSIGSTLKEGWGKFIYDEAVKRFGDDTLFKIRNARKELFKSLANKDTGELKQIPERLRIEVLEGSMADIEQPTRPIASELFEKLFNLQEYRSLKMNFFSNVPLNILSASEGKNVFSVGNFYVDEKTIDLFVGTKEAFETMVVVGEAISYVRSTKTDWNTFGELRGQKKAALYAKNLYKLFHKNLKEESLDTGLDKIVNEFNEGLLVKGLIGLRNNPSFEPTIKNMTNVILFEFGDGIVEGYTSQMKANFFFDKLGADNIKKGIQKYEGIGGSYLFAMDMLLNYFTAVFTGLERVVFDKDLKLCIEMKGKNEPGEKNKIQSIILNAYSTAAFEDMVWLEGMKPVGQALVGINVAEFLFPETKRRLNIGLMGGPSADIKANTLVYADATLIYPKTGIMDFNLFTSPMLTMVFNNLDPNGKFDERVANKLNAFWPVKMGKPLFKYEKGEYDSILCSLSADVYISTAKAKRRVKKK